MDMDGRKGVQYSRGATGKTGRKMRRRTWPELVRRWDERVCLCSVAVSFV